MLQKCQHLTDIILGILEENIKDSLALIKTPRAAFSHHSGEKKTTFSLVSSSFYFVCENLRLCYLLTSGPLGVLEEEGVSLKALRTVRACLSLAAHVAAQSWFPASVPLTTGILKEAELVPAHSSSPQKYFPRECQK